jgi:putative ATPase
VESNVADMRRVLATAANRLENKGQSTILFIDEIHRFNKAQQDVLLPDVEGGVVRLIGATTHNPFFFVNSPLVSRSQIFELRPLAEEDFRAAPARPGGPGTRPGLPQGPGGGSGAAPSGQAVRWRRAQGIERLEIAALTTAPDSGG